MMVQPGLRSGQRLLWDGSDVYQLVGDVATERLGNWNSKLQEYDSKELHLIKPLGPRDEYSSVWLCEGPDQIQLVVKMFAQEFYLDIEDEEGETIVSERTVSIA